MINESYFISIRRKIHTWYEQNARDLPWRQTRDPYVIWLSEIILQQTRVDQGMPYFIKFTNTYPDVFKLASASLDEIKKNWEGLGYYRRADHLHATAKIIAEKYQGVFPGTYGELLKLPGIGPYTAAAIASFSFDQPVAVLDGNVFRVLSRLFDIKNPVNTPNGKKLFTRYADLFLDKSRPALHNQSVMEFGALQCKPGVPDCLICPVRDECLAYMHKSVSQRPVKIPLRKRKNRFIYYLISIRNGKIGLKKRNQNDIWKGLYDFSNIESDKRLKEKEILEKFKNRFGVMTGDVMPLEEMTHDLTHRRLFLSFWLTEETLGGLQYIDIEQVFDYAFPRPLRKILDDLINITNFEK